MKPRMREQVLKTRPLIGLNLKTLADQVLTFDGKSDPETKFSPTNLLVRLEGDVPADHVVEEDAHAPDGRLFAVVTTCADPLWRGVHSSTCEKMRKFIFIRLLNFSAKCRRDHEHQTKTNCV